MGWDLSGCHRPAALALSALHPGDRVARRDLLSPGPSAGAGRVDCQALPWRSAPPPRGSVVTPAAFPGRLRRPPAFIQLKRSHEASRRASRGLSRGRHAHHNSCVSWHACCFLGRLRRPPAFIQLRRNDEASGRASRAPSRGRHVRRLAQAAASRERHAGLASASRRSVSAMCTVTRPSREASRTSPQRHASVT
jgi:hypothetical protein